MAAPIFTSKGFTIIFIIALVILNFESIETKKFRGPTKCTQPKSVGICQALIPRWYFDTETGRCKEFNYGGCGGNENNFRGIEECRRACRNWILFHG